MVMGLRHLAVVTSVVAEFGAAWRGCTVVDCGGNCRHGKVLRV